MPIQQFFWYVSVCNVYLRINKTIYVLHHHNAYQQIVKELVAIFPVLRDWIAEFLSENKCMYASEIGHNMLLEQVGIALHHTF